MKGWRFDARSESGVRQSSSSSLPAGQVFRHRSESGDDGCLAGRLTGSSASVIKTVKVVCMCSTVKSTRLYTEHVHSCLEEAQKGLGQ